MKRVVLFLFLVLLVPNGHLFLQEIPDCCCVPLSYPPTGQQINSDSSLVIDTCGILYSSRNCDYAYWNNIRSISYREEAEERVYGKSYWLIIFTEDVIQIETAPWDSMLYVNWSNYDSINYPEIKEKFIKLDSLYGNFKLRKIYPDIDTGYKSEHFELTFENYVRVKEVGRFLWKIPYTRNEFQGWPVISGTDVEDNNKKCVELIIQIYPNPANEYIEIDYQNVETGIRPVSTGIIEIYNVFWERVKTETIHPMTASHRMNIEHLPEGVYFVRINGMIMKFIKV